MKIKTCGLTKLNQIQELISLNVDFLGFIFYEKSPRFVLSYLNLNEIKNIQHPRKVGVFVNESLEKILKISEEAGLNFIQLHGDENSEFISELIQKINPKIKIIKVIRVGTQNLKPETWNSEQIDYLLFDTDSKAFGGTGTAFDWNILNEFEIAKPYFLSGGISLENFENIKDLNQKPFALDINSKFETEPGVKDLDKIKTFNTKINAL